MPQVSILEASVHLGVSHDTIRRRIRNGGLKAEKVPTPKGPAWMIDLPDDAHAGSSAASAEPYAENEEAYASHDGDGKVAWAEVRRLEQMVSILQGEVDTRRREVQELHVLLQQQAVALPAPRENHHSWWRFWGR